MARDEILHLRDARLSLRHRYYYGPDCPMIDLDWIVAEYASRTPAAIIEYKHASPGGNSRPRENANLDTFRALATMAGLPAWVAIYRPASWSYKVFPQNAAACVLVGVGPGAHRYMTEREYVELLHRVRGVPTPSRVLDGLNATHRPLVDPD
jgi:hypothetical protein